MIDHVTIPVTDLERSKSFYEQALKPLGYKISFGEVPPIQYGQSTPSRGLRESRFGSRCPRRSPQ